MSTMLVRETFFWTNSQLAGQILFCPDVSARHFQKLFRALIFYDSLPVIKYPVLFYNHIRYLTLLSLHTMIGATL